MIWKRSIFKKFKSTVDKLDYAGCKISYQQGDATKFSLNKTNSHPPFKNVWSASRRPILERTFEIVPFPQFVALIK